MEGFRIVDVHTHIYSEEFSEDLDDVINRAKSKGIIAIVNSGLGPDGIERSIEISNGFKGYVFNTFGIEPYKFDKEEVERTIDLIKENRKDIVGVGEVGLDYYWVKDHSLREIMAENFRRFIEISIEFKKPLIVHSRSAGKYALKILIEMDVENVLMHAFDGATKWVKLGISHGYMFSVPTSVVFSRQKQKMVKVLPLENMMLESDAPVLSPIPNKRNEPSFIEYSIKKISEIKGVGEEKIADITTENALSFFKIKPTSF
ncbi:MAG: TatD family hydrolase [Candidatus Asgardarchaeia archaeon]